MTKPSRDGAEAPVVSAVVVSYNTAEVTLRCLEALKVAFAQEQVTGEIILVDNASTDDSVRRTKEAHPDARVIANSGNRGFGAANNQGIAAANGRFLLLINSDAFIASGSLRPMLRNMADDAVAVVGPRLLNPDGSLQPSCYHDVTPARAWMENLFLMRFMPPRHRLGDLGRWRHDHETDVDWVSGACMLVRRAVVAVVGGFDEAFFMYQEETDWQRRMRQAGWRIRFCPDATVTHLGGGSGASEPARIKAAFFESLDRYMLKHFGRSGVTQVRLAMIAGSCLRLVMWAGRLLLRSPSREVVRSKLRLYGWLVRRQALEWRVLREAQQCAEGVL